VESFKDYFCGLDFICRFIETEKKKTTFGKNLYRRKSYGEELVKQQPILRTRKSMEKIHFISSINCKVLVFSILMLQGIISQWIPGVFFLK